MPGPTPITFTLRRGVVGAGQVAASFVSDLSLDRAQHRRDNTIRHVIQAIGSSSLEKATIFAATNAPNALPNLYDNYESVYNDPDVDIVYIATPHSLHLKNALDAMEAGKHVLVEKPIAINAREAAIMIAKAREKTLYLMEGVWTRFFELSLKLKHLIHKQKILGDISRLRCDFPLYLPIKNSNPTSRLANQSLGAGCLLDIGIYPLTWSRMLIHEDPSHDGSTPFIVSTLSLNGGIDEMSSVIINYANSNKQAICTATYLSKGPSEFAYIDGSLGTISIWGPCSRPQGFRVDLADGTSTSHDFALRDAKGLFYEADAVARDIRDGRKESSIMPLEESLAMMKLMDNIRASGGVSYPQDLT